MEFQEGLMRLMIQEKSDKQRHSRKPKKTTTGTDTDNNNNNNKKLSKWKIFLKSPSSIAKTTTRLKQEPTPTKTTTATTTAIPPSEFLCPITGSLMAEPVIVSSGHSFERGCVEACKAVDFTPTMADSSAADFSSVIPNLALKSTIAAWCKLHSVGPLRQLDSAAAESLVRSFMESRGQSPRSKDKAEEESEAKTTLEERTITLDLSWRRNWPSVSSTESVKTTSCVPSSEAETTKQESASPASSSSSSSSSEAEAAKQDSSSSSTASLVEIVSHPGILFEEDEILEKLKSQQVFDVIEALTALRETTRDVKESRARLCTHRLLAALQTLIPSRYTGVQVNSIAALVNLSLERSNKSRIVRAGMLPQLIDVLKSGSLEAQEQATGAIFSLALDDENKVAIGVLGALQPLICLLRAEGYRTRRDSVLTLYHLSLMGTNRSKLVKLGAVPVLLNMVRSGNMTNRVMMVLSSLSLSPDGRVSLMDAGAVETVVGVLSGNVGSMSAKESGVMILYALSHSRIRFRALAKAAGVMGALRLVAESGSQKAKERARMVTEALKGRVDETEDVNWEELLELGFESENRSRLTSETSKSITNSSV